MSHLLIFLFFQTFYDDFQKALIDVKSFKISGFLHFLPNFTNALPLFNDEAAEDDKSDTIQVFLDQTNIQTTLFIKKNIYETYNKFTARLMIDCGKSEKAGSSPISFEAEFGRIDFDFKTTLISGFLLS